MLAKELAQCLAPAYRCAALDGACKGMRYRPEHGLFPRGYAGATGSLSDVELVLCIAEPGEPPTNPPPLLDVQAIALPALLAAHVAEAFRSRKSPFHRNVGTLLDCCFPNQSFEERLRRTSITEGVLCSAAKTTGRVPLAVERECASRYLSAQLELLPDAFVVALGRKAERRLKLAGRVPNAAVVAAGPPGGNSKKAKPSWQAAGRAFQEHVRRLSSRRQAERPIR